MLDVVYAFPGLDGGLAQSCMQAPNLRGLVGDLWKFLLKELLQKREVVNVECFFALHEL